MDAFPMTTSFYGAEQLVESAGTVLFRLSTHEICILRQLNKPDEYVLPKGRRNVGEARKATAVRETTEETGFPCYLLPVDVISRVTPTVQEGPDVPDEPRLYKGACEPIAMQQRDYGRGEIKLVWWYVAAVNEDELRRQHEADKFEVEFYSYDEAVRKMTFKDDRDLVERAIRLVDATFNC